MADIKRKKFSKFLGEMYLSKYQFMYDNFENIYHL